MINFQPFGVGSSGTMQYTLNAMLGAMNPMFSVPDKRQFGEDSMREAQRILRLLDYPYFLDEQVDSEKWEILAREYRRITGKNVSTFTGVVEESVRLDLIHERIAAREAELRAELGMTEDE